ncbi:MAG: hypothetical protein GQ544_07305 [Candidatus Aminicenantes bacterium]|nr:hypothetical protein [Candidatus Aminicenantes bacterium]
MKFKIEEIESRREFLKKSTRTLVMGGFVLLGGFLGMRRSDGENSASSCVLNLPCRDCVSLSRCQEPRALPFKKNEGFAQGFKNEKR